MRFRLRWRELAFLAVCVVHLVALYLPSPPGAPASVLAVPHLDKLVHVLLFAMVAFTGRWAGVPIRLLLLALTADAVMSELVQGLWLPERSADPIDLLADLVGIAVGMLAATRWGLVRIGAPNQP